MNRVRKRGPGRRLQEAHFYPEIIKLRANGWTYKDMARYIGHAGGPRTDRRYTQIVTAIRRLDQPRDISEDLAPDLQSMLQWDVKSFERFFLRFSPHDYMPAHVRSWIGAFLRERNLMLNVPPGHAKSEFFMIWIPVWLICRDRNVQILMVSNAHEDATTWALEVAGQLEHNDELIHCFGRFAPETTGDQRWSPAKGVFSVIGRTRKMKGAQFTMESRGMTGRVLGRRADFVIVDDPTKQEDAESPLERTRQLKHLQQQVFTRAEPEGEEWKGGRIVVIGQRVHLLDLYGELEKQEWTRTAKKGEKAWHVEKFPAVLDWDTHKVLWPERWPWEEIEMAYVRCGGAGPFSTMYQQQPMPEGEALVTQAWIDACKDFDRGAGKGYRKSADGFPPITTVLSVDPSPTKFNGIVMGELAYHRENFAFAVTHVQRLQAGVRQLQAECDRLIAIHHPDYFIFEESGFLAWFRDDPWFLDIQKRTKLLLHKTGVNKNSMEYGVQSLAGDFEFQRISLPYGNEEARRMTEMLANEALIYPAGDTSDLLMALWFVKFNHRKLAPVRMLPRRVRGTSEGGWSWLRQMKPKSRTDLYHRLQSEQEKAKASIG